MFAGVFPQLDFAETSCGSAIRTTRDPVGGHLQRPRYRRADPVGPCGAWKFRALGAGRDPSPQTCSSTGIGGDHRPIHRDQAHRSRHPPRWECTDVASSNFVTGLLMTIVLTVLLGFAYPLVVHRHLSQPSRLSKRANGSLVKGRRQGCGLVVDRPGLRRTRTANPLPKYFQPRPLQCGPTAYDAIGELPGRTFGPSNPNLIGQRSRCRVSATNGKPLTTKRVRNGRRPLTAFRSRRPTRTATDVTDSGGQTRCTRRTRTARTSADPNTVPERVPRLPGRSTVSLRTSRVPSDAVTSSAFGSRPTDLGRERKACKLIGSPRARQPDRRAGVGGDRRAHPESSTRRPRRADC